jgi:outer membrane murein-binding lipoprotein Lpp
MDKDKEAQYVQAVEPLNAKVKQLEQDIEKLQLTLDFERAEKAELQQIIDSLDD